MNAFGFCIIAYFAIGVAFALISLHLCTLRCDKAFLRKKANSDFSNRTLIIVNNLCFWQLYFPSLMNELGIIRLPDWLNVIR